MEEEQRGRGRPPHVPDDKTRTMVRMMSALGISEDDMGLILQIDPKTLRKYYAEQLRIGHLEATTKVAAALYSTALKGGREGTQAAIFWLRCRAGWRDDGFRKLNDAPAPEPKAEPLGKKAAAQAAALEAAEGTEWHSLLPH